MNNGLSLSSYELNLVSNGLKIMIIENVKESKEATEIRTQQQHENLGLELFNLFSKVKLFDAEASLSLNELRLIKSSLMFLAAYVYQKSLKKIERDKVKYYEDCNLQFVKLRNKINRMELYGT